MKSKRQFQQRGDNTPTLPTVPITQAQNAPVASSIMFTVVPMSAVPEKKTPGTAMAKYRELEAALLKLPAGQALSVPVPEGKQSQKFANNILNSLRKRIPGTRSRTTQTQVYFWVGEVSPARNTHSVKGAA